MNADNHTIEDQVPIEMAGQRLDKVLPELFSAYSRSRLQGWMKQGRVLLNGQPVSKGNIKVKALDRIVLDPGVLEHMQALQPEAMNLDVVGESEDFWVINKPPGLVVHPGPGHWSGTLMNGLLHLDSGLIDVPRAGIVHRLDRDTTGLMAIARHSNAQVALIQMLQARIVKRVYLALVWGRVPRAVTVNKPIGRDPRNRLKMAVVDFGKPAVTHFEPIAHGELCSVPVTLMACRLETGRTHQIRVHGQHGGFALVADPVYKLRGAGSHSALSLGKIELSQEGAVFERQALHATHLSFPDPLEFEPEAGFSNRKEWDRFLGQLHWPEFMAPVPPDMQALGEMAGMNFCCEAVCEAVSRVAQAHKASTLALLDGDSPADNDSFDDDFDESDYEVETIDVSRIQDD